MIIIGIDPGKAGGIAVMDAGVASVYKMPTKVSELAALVRRFENPIVFVERLSARPSDLVGGKMFGIKKMLANFEQIKAALEVSNIPYVLTHPQRWQNHLGFPKGVGEKAERKKMFQSWAAAQYPYIKVTLWNADALCIMTFGMQAVQKELRWVLSQLPLVQRNRLINQDYVK